MKKFLLKTLVGISLISVFGACKNTVEEPKLAHNKTEAYHFDTLTLAQAEAMASMPLKCILQEYPNKTGHTASGDADILKTPKQLHPSFYGCFDWHSSVHGHWMLARIWNIYPQLELRNEIWKVLSETIQPQKIQQEVAYFDQNLLGKSFERTYGWAWILKLDQELTSSKNDSLKLLAQHLKPLTQKVVTLWKDYLPKQSYPNRTGVHNNTAFGLRLALDWAKANQDTTWQRQIEEKAKLFYANNKAIPTYLEPDGSDFFSPSLYVADLMSQIMPMEEFNLWLNSYFTQEGIDRLCEVPQVSDRNDYQIVHLNGLMFSRAWNMRSLIPYIQHKQWRQQFINAEQLLLRTGLQHLSASNYGGEHWLGSFATLALTGYR